MLVILNVGCRLHFGNTRISISKTHYDTTEFKALLDYEHIFLKLQFIFPMRLDLSIIRGRL